MFLRKLPLTTLLLLAGRWTSVAGLTYDFTEQLSAEMLLEYSIDNTAGTMSARVTYDGNGWVALAFSEDRNMQGSIGIIGEPGNGPPTKFDLLGLSPRIEELENSRQTLTDESIVQENGKTILTFTKILEEVGEVPINTDGSTTWILYAHGGTSNDVGYHGQNKGSKELTFGSATGSPTISPAPTTALPSMSPTASPAPTAALPAEFDARLRLTDQLTMEYAIENADDPVAAVLLARLVYDGLGWIGIGVSPNGQMVGGEAIVGIPNSGSPPQKYRLGGKVRSAVAPLPQSQQTLTDASIEQVNGQTIMTFKRLLNEEGELEILVSGDNQLIYAVGSGNELAQHPGGQSRGAQTVNFSTGGSAEVEIPYQTEWKAHGGMAFAGWGVTTPLAIASSWLRDVFPGNGLWFKAHILFNVLTFLLTAALFGVAVSTFNKEGLDHFAGGTPASSHTRMGLAMFVLVCIQVLGGFLRPHLPSPSDSPPPQNATSPSREEGDDSGKEGNNTNKEAMSKVRMGWEFFHKLSGVALLACGLWQINRGLELYELKYEETLISKGAFWGWIGGFAGVVVFLTIYDKCLLKKKA